MNSLLNCCASSDCYELGATAISILNWHQEIDVGFILCLTSPSIFLGLLANDSQAMFNAAKSSFNTNANENELTY